MPEMSAEVLFCDVELRAIKDFTIKRKLAVKTGTVEWSLTIMVAMSVDMVYRKGPSGAKLLWKGVTVLSNCASTFERWMELSGVGDTYQIIRSDKDVCNSN